VLSAPSWMPARDARSRFSESCRQQAHGTGEIVRIALVDEYQPTFLFVPSSITQALCLSPLYYLRTYSGSDTSCSRKYCVSSPPFSTFAPFSLSP